MVLYMLSFFLIPKEVLHKLSLDSFGKGIREKNKYQLAK
jgi:hypothetical protein